MAKYRMLIQWIDEIHGNLTEENAGAEYVTTAPNLETAILKLQGMAFMENWTYDGSVFRVEERERNA